MSPFANKRLPSWGIKTFRCILALMLVLSLVSVLPVQPVLAGDSQGDTAHFAIITDFGTLDTTQAAVATMVDSWQPEFIVTAGDNWQQSSMGDPGTTNSYENAVGNYYGEGAVGLERTTVDYVGSERFWPVKGNHDYDAGTGRYEAYFDYLPHEEHEGTAAFYQFIEGPLHFFMLDSGSLWGSPPDIDTQKDWLEAELDASTAPWQIVVFHKPAYTGSSVHSNETSMQWPFAEWGADFIIAGHTHIYERIHQDGIRYFTAGTAAGNARTGTKIGEVYYSGPGAMRVDASDASITFEYVSVDGTVRDTFTETREAPDSPTITTSASSLTHYVSQPGVPSAEQSYAVSGVNLKGDITVTPPAGFEMSTTSGTGFGTESIVLSPTDGTLPPTSLYVRLNRDTTGTSSGNITHESDDAQQRSVAVTGTVTDSTAWVAYNDVAWASGQPSTNITTFTIPEEGTSAGRLVDYHTGVETPVSVSIDASGGPLIQTTEDYAGSGTAPGTDAHSTFDGIVDMAGLVVYGDDEEGWYVDLTFDGLDPESTYVFATSANRNGSSYTRDSRFTLSGVEAAINASTSGVGVLSNESVYFNTGYNTTNGYVARWVGISPGSDGRFTVRAEAHNKEGEEAHKAYGPSVFMLGLEGDLVTYQLTADDDGDGSVQLSPPGGVYPAGATVTLTPVAGPGYAFGHWSGPDADDIVLSGGVYTIVMDGDKAVTANFEVPLCTDVSLVASADTWLRSSYPDRSYGGSAELQVGTSSARPQNSLLRWDLNSIPPEATITTASLTFHVTEPTPNAFRLYDMRRSWVEGDSDDATSTTSANWATYDGVSAWGAEGAESPNEDRYDTNLWDAVASTFNASGSQTIGLNASGVAVVQGWVDGALDNHGLTVQRETGTSSSNYWKVASREAADDTLRPRLNVSYCLPATDPTITTSVASLPAFDSEPGEPSQERSYMVSAVNLTDSLLIAAPPEFAISTTSGGGFGPTISLTPVDGTIASTPVYVRFMRATEGTSTGAISHTSVGASPKAVQVSGTATLTPPWTAYNDVSGTGSPSHTTEYSIGTTNGMLLDFETGAETGVTVTATTSGELFDYEDGGGPTDAGTDAYEIFADHVNMAGNIQYNVSDPADFWMDLTFDGLDPNKTYTFAATANRAGGTGGSSPSYPERITRYTISGADGATNASSAGVGIVSNESVYFCTGENTAAGYVARWDNIRAGSDGSFTVRAQPHDPTVYRTYAYGMFMLQEKVVGPAYALTVSTVGQGAVDVDPDQATYAYGDEVALTALPEPGWTFVGWSGALSGSANPASLTMDADKAITATFAQDAYALTVSTVGQGAVDVDPDQATYAHGDEVALTALPEPGWTFVGWSGDASGTTNPLTVTISGDTDITATFALAVEEPENPVPILTSLDPSEAVIGDPGFSLKVMGTGFVTGATVHWDGSPKNTTFISSEELLADITADDLTTERTVEVTVVNPGPGGGESGPLPFEVLEVHTGPGPEIVLCLPLILN